MAKAIYVCSRNRPLGSADKDRLTGICEALTPDNIVTPVSHRVAVVDHTACAVMNYQPSNLIKENSLLLGYLYDRSENWNIPLTDFPDGSYAIFRVNDDYLEAVSDPVASRTIWYYFDEEWFIAATSQRAIIMFLGSFHFDERVIPWMLSAGSLGPELAWDNRIVRLQLDASVVLDRKNWSISTRQTPIHFTVKDRSESEHERMLKEALNTTIESLKDVNLNDWVLPLSGGYDSRAILCWLNEAGLISEDFRTITWGLEESLTKAGNDAKVAKDVADALGVRNKFYPTNISEEPIARVIDRFLFLVEGRSNNLTGYMDGMKIWKDLVEDGVRGIIKGDVYIGWLPVSSATMVRLQVGCPLCSDYSNLTGVIEKFGLSDQKLPDYLEHRDESFISWRDRLFYVFRIPTLYAAASDIKFSYMEQISPLMSRRILDRARELPDRLRVDKYLYAQIIKTITPEVRYADKLATAKLEDILSNSSVVDLLHNTIQGDYARSLFSPEFLKWIDSGISSESTSLRKMSFSLKKLVRKLIPRSIKHLLMGSGAVKPKLNGNILAFRVYIISRMHEILSEDCNRVRE